MIKGTNINRKEGENNMTIFQQEMLKGIKAIIENNHFQKDRIKKLESAGIDVEKQVSSMETGGTGLIRFFPNLGVSRVQIGCNYGGFSTCAVLKGDYSGIVMFDHLFR